MSELIDGLAGLDQKRYSFLADVGDCWFIGLELRTDIFMAPGYYASMGFAVPGALGAAMAEPRLRPVVIVGDGAFQMTGAEMATLARYGFAPIVVVVNNASYKMLGTFDQPRTYYELPTWDYAGYARSLGCEGQRATTAVELADALDAAIQSESPFLVEAVIERLDDHPPIMQRIREFFGK
jgi:indolepyruvate decarboxylase